MAGHIGTLLILSLIYNYGKYAASLDGFTFSYHNDSTIAAIPSPIMARLVPYETSTSGLGKYLYRV